MKKQLFSTALAGLVLFSVGPGFAVTSPEGKKIRVAVLLPFDGTTEATPDSIQKDAVCVYELPASGKEALSMRKLLNSGGPGAFDNKAVRLKVSGLFPEDVYVDKSGGVAPGKSARHYRITKNALTTLERLSEKHAKTNAECLNKRPAK